MLADILQKITTEHVQVIIAVVSGSILYAYGLYKWIIGAVTEKMQGCNMNHTTTMKQMQDEQRQIKENYLQRFEEVKDEIRETKKDVLERVEMIIELLKLKKHE